MVCVITDMTCRNEVNRHYYAKRLNFPKVCYVCGSEEVLEVSKEIRERHQTVHPICQSCKDAGYEVRTRGESQHDKGPAKKKQKK